jgi:hypothetical protein
LDPHLTRKTWERPDDPRKGYSIYDDALYKVWNANYEEYANRERALRASRADMDLEGDEIYWAGYRALVDEFRQRLYERHPDYLINQQELYAEVAALYEVRPPAAHAARPLVLLLRNWLLHPLPPCPPCHLRCDGAAAEMLKLATVRCSPSALAAGCCVAFRRATSRWRCTSPASGRGSSHHQSRGRRSQPSSARAASSFRGGLPPSSYST